jgi:hypothetical protein
VGRAPTGPSAWPRKYNDEYNNIRLPEYGSAHLTLPGINKAILRGGDLGPHHAN